MPPPQVLALAILGRQPSEWLEWVLRIALVAVGLRLLLTRRPVPFAVPVALGLAVAAATPVDGWWGRATTPDPDHLDPAYFWGRYAAVVALAIVLRPPAGSVRRPERLGWAVGGVVLAAASPSDGYRLLFALPPILALWDSPAVAAVRSELALLLALAAAGSLAAIAPWAAVSAFSGRPADLAALLLPLIPMGWAVIQLAAVGLRLDRLAWIAPAALWWGVSSAVDGERASRGARQLRGVDVAGLPTGDDRSVLWWPGCFRTPADPDPPCVGDRLSVWVWPADRPLARLVVGERRAAVAYAGPFGPSVRFLGDLGSAPARVRVGREPDGYTVGGKLVRGDLAAEADDARSACALSSGYALDPAVDWTAHELVDLCREGCVLADDGGCRWDTGLGWVAHCSPWSDCSVGRATARCDGAGCVVLLDPGEGPPPVAAARVVCPAGGCVILARGLDLVVECAGGGCVVIGGGAVSIDGPRSRVVPKGSAAP